jgi:transcriptional regulator with XRE-family HTH domain
MAKTAERPFQLRIARNLRTLARDRGIPIQLVAHRLGISRQQLHSRLNGQTGLEVDELRELARILETSVDELLRDPEERFPRPPDQGEHGSGWIPITAGHRPYAAAA